MIIDLLTKVLNNHGLNPSFAVLLSVLIILAGVAGVAWVSYYIARKYLVKLIRSIIAKLQPRWGEGLVKKKVLQRLSHLAPALVIYYFSSTLTNDLVSSIASLSVFLRTFSVVYLLVVLALSVNGLLSTIGDVYRNLEIAKQRPIRSYIQVAKIFLYGLSGILVVAAGLGKSPLTLLTGLGALTAILVLVFKDSILGFVASVQISTYDMVRIGDWIEMPKYGVDGDVVEMSLNTIQVRNFDKTIVTIPSHAVLSDGVKNWRGMAEAGGRRIKRSIYININSIKFCTPAMLERFSRVQYLADYINGKREEINQHNAALNADLSMLVNGRNLTNLGVFRAYLEAYLRGHSKVQQSNRFTFLVRQLQPTEKGLPLQIYVFTTDTNWSRYESIQSDIFDHILAILPEFDLQIFQDFNGRDVSSQFSGTPQKEPSLVS